MGELDSKVELIKAISDNLNLGVTIIDKDMKIVWVNNFLQNKGFKLDNVVGTNCFTTFENQDKICEECSTFQSFKTSQTNKEIRKGADGNDYEITSIPIKKNRGVEYVVEISRNLSQIKVEQALKESEEKYRKQFEEAMEAIFIADAETGIIIDCNRAACKLVSREKSELVGKHQRILHPPEKIEGEFSKTFKQHLKEKEGQILEAQVITKEGEIKEVAIKANLLEHKDKKLIQGIFRDITEQKEAERKIRESEEKYRTLVENLPQKIFYKDRNCVYVSCNENYARDLKIKPNQITGKTDYDFYPKELAEKYRADDKKLMETDKTEEIEEGYIQEGKQLFVHTVKTPIKDKSGNIIGILGIFWDITDRKKAEEELKKLTQQLEQKVKDKTKELKQLYMFSEDIIKNAPIGVYTIDKEGIIDLFNPAMVRLAGAESAKQILGSNVFEMESYKKAGLIPYFKQGLEGTPFELDNVEYVSQTSGKHSIRYYMGVPIKNEKGEVERLLLLVEDITQRKQTENKLKKFSEELEQKVEERAKELKAKVEELERFNKLAVGRELKMIELKKRIRELEEKLKSKES